EHTVFEGEITGVLLATQLARNALRLRCHRIRTVLIALDNQPVISALNANRRQPGQYLLDEVHKALQKLHTDYPRTHIHIAWTPGHHDIPGNEHVDLEAKSAAEGHSSPSDTLPSLLHSPLPKSVAALRA
ncbi:hypothetical protein B0H21DRAFT_661666, partial [Amylocystis lapponica]